MGSPIFVICVSIVFIGFFVTSLAPLVSEWGYRAVSDNNLSGMEAFVYENVNFFMICFFIIFLYGYSAWSG